MRTEVAALICPTIPTSTAHISMKHKMTQLIKRCPSMQAAPGVLTTFKRTWIKYVADERLTLTFLLMCDLCLDDFLPSEDLVDAFVEMDALLRRGLHVFEGVSTSSADKSPTAGLSLLSFFLFIGRQHQPE